MFYSRHYINACYFTQVVNARLVSMREREKNKGIETERRVKEREIEIDREIEHEREKDERGEYERKSEKKR